MGTLKMIRTGTFLFMGMFLSSFFSYKELRFTDVSNTYIPVTDLGDSTMDIEMADVDGDGDEDMILAIEFKPNILLINDGKGKFTNESNARLPQVSHDSEDVGLGDFDQDGDVDIIFVSEDDQVHEYYLNNSKGYFKENSASLAVTSTCNAIDVGDYDRDGDLDLILGNDGQDFFLQNDGKGVFENASKDHLPIDYSITQDVQSTDIDGDLDLDLLIGNENGNRIYTNNGKGVFTDATFDRLPSANEETRKVDLGDVDSDGDMDLFFSNVDFRGGKDKTNRLLINNGKGFFSDETALRFPVTGNMHTADAQFCDLDGDRDLDIVIANVFGGYLQIALNDGKGKFREVTDEVFAQKQRVEDISVEVCDFNRDGKLDIFLGMFRATDRMFFGQP